jgi:hypothetical protein
MKDSGALAIWRLRGYWGVSIRGTSCVVPQIISPSAGNSRVARDAAVAMANYARL